MALFQRIKTPFAEADTEGEGQFSSGPRSAGDVLRQQREELRLSLDEVALALKIKPAFIAALEDGRPDRLPGPAYAIGFLRSYGDYLGLDSAEVLRRFKAESTGLDVKPDLSFPMPLGERGLPGGSMLLVALILGVCGYGAWYYLATAEHSRLPRVSEVPASLLPQTPPKPNSPPSEQAPQGNPISASTVPAAKPPPSSGFASAASTKALSLRAPSAETTPGSAQAGANPSASPPTTPATVRARSTPVQAPAVSEPSFPPAAPANPGSLTAKGAATPAPPAAASTSESAAGQAATAAAAPSGGGPASAKATAAAAPTLPATQAKSASAGAGAGDASRVVLHASADTWVELRDQTGAVLLERVLKAGETYPVPDKKGLTLITGNAGGLTISVDGKQLPPLGPAGAVRRDIALDPQALLAKQSG